MKLKTEKAASSRLCQGDIIRDVDCIEYVSEKSGVIEVSRIVFPLVVVLTQDCDLEQDYKCHGETAKQIQDKLLISVLVAPIYNVEHVYRGEHLSDLKVSMQPVPKTKSPGNFLRNNERPRYHYLDFPDDIPIVTSVIDFKHYFSVNAKHLTALKTSNYVCGLSPLFREDVSQRFASFLSRIGLPDLVATEAEAKAGESIG